MADDASDEKKRAKSVEAEAKAQEQAEKAELKRQEAERKAAEERAQRAVDASQTSDPVNNDAPTPDEKPTEGLTPAPTAPNVEVVRGVPVKGSEEVETVTTQNSPDLQTSGSPVKPTKRLQRTHSSSGRAPVDVQALIDAMPDELYEAFVEPYNLNERGVDQGTGFDLLAINNPTLDAVRLNLRGTGINI